MPRRRAFGSIQQAGEGAWRIWWTAGGVRHSRTVHGARADAARELAKLEIEVEGVKADMVWGRYWEMRVLPSLSGLERKTIDDYVGTWDRHLARRIGARWISQTTPRMVEAVLAEIEPGPAVKAARLWKKMVRMAVADGILSRDVFQAVRIHVPQRRPKRLLDASEVRGWMEGLRGSKYEAVLLCELGGGLRHEEACALAWDDVERWEWRGVVYAVLSVSKALVVASGGKYLKSTKTAFSGREVVLGEPFASRILELRGSGPLSPSGLVDNWDPAAPYTSPATLTRNYRAWCDRHGMVYVTPAHLRSTFATLHGEAGSPDSLVSGAMGHADATTKARNYQQITRRGLALIADNLAEFLASF